MREKEKGESQDERRVHVPPVLEGRLRIRLPGVKGPQSEARWSLVMNDASTSLRVLEGRLRIRLPQVKGSESEARWVETRLQEIEGVNRASANPLTGSVLVVFDTRQIATHEIVAALCSWGYLGEQRHSDGRVAPGDGLRETSRHDGARAPAASRRPHLKF